MKRIALLVALVGTLAAAQTSTPPPAPKPATPAAKPAVKAKPTVPALPRTACQASVVLGVKLPPGVPPVAARLKPAFTLCYEDIKLGTGPEAETNKMWHVTYTGWLASDGRKFDSSFDHRPPQMDKDGKPVKDADGKPVLGEPQPFVFPQGFGRVIPGWDHGVEGMKIGGKRRLFVPWQLAYGVRGIPDRDKEHLGIPPKADLIFDVELLEVTDMPSRPPQGMPPPGRPMPGRPGSGPGAPPAPGSTSPSGAPGIVLGAPKPAAPSTPPPATPAPAAPVPATPAPATPAPASSAPSQPAAPAQQK